MMAVSPVVSGASFVSQFEFVFQSAGVVRAAVTFVVDVTASAECEYASNKAPAAIATNRLLNFIVDLPKLVVTQVARQKNAANAFGQSIKFSAFGCWCVGLTPRTSGYKHYRVSMSMARARRTPV